MREELARHGGQLTAVPQISQNLLTILRVLKEEERYEAQYLVDPDHNANDTAVGAMSESLEYFIEKRMLQILVSYALTDEPRGFFKFLLGVVEDLLQSVHRKHSSILSHTSVHGSVRQILQSVYMRLLELPFEDGNEDQARKPNHEFA